MPGGCQRVKPMPKILRDRGKKNTELKKSLRSGTELRGVFTMGNFPTPGGCQRVKLQTKTSPRPLVCKQQSTS